MVIITGQSNCMFMLFSFLLKGWIRRQCLNHYLIEQGLALVSLESDMGDYWRNSSVIERLVKAEVRAEKKRRGVWQRPTFRDKIRSYPEHLKNKLHLSALTRWMTKIKDIGSNVVKKLKR